MLMTSFPERTRGIPDEIFILEKHQVVPGLSGESQIDCQFRLHEVKLRDVKDPNLHINATVTGDTLEMGVRTQYRTRDRLIKHPDLSPASVVVRQVFDFFQRYGVPLSVWRARWIAPYLPGGLFPSKNFEQYHTNIKKFGSHPTHEEKVQAALATWTGEQAVVHGFSCVAAVEDDDPGDIRVTFRKP
jgi:hypothetical protein